MSSFYYLTSLSVFTAMTFWYLWISLKTRTFKSWTFLIGVSVLLVLGYEFIREIQILVTGCVPAPSYLRARAMFYEGALFATLIHEVRLQYAKLTRKTS